MARKTCFTDARTIAADVRAGTLSPVTVVEEHLDRIKDVNDDLTAYVTVLGDEARERARDIERALADGDDVGPLAGVPVALKDLYAAKAGVKETCGCKPLADARSEQDATFVERIEDAGGIVLGKTNVPEFGHKGTTDNELFGPTSTPFDVNRNAGGSSGGSAAAVAAGLAPLAQGSDGGGSIRIPASFCGVYGFKASHRRVPNRERPDAFGGIAPYTHYGPLTRTVADAALMLDTIAGPHPADPFTLPDDGTNYMGALEEPIDNLSVAYSPRLDGFPVDERVLDVVDEAVGAFVNSGADVVEASPDVPYSHRELCETWMRMHERLLAKTNETVKRTSDVDLLGDHREELTPVVAKQMEAGYETDTAAAFEWSVVRTAVFDSIQSILADHDILVTPTLAVPPVDNGVTMDGQVVGPTEVDGQDVDPLLGWCLTYPINFTGHPAASVPAGLTDEGLPVGLQIIGRRFDDETVLAASAAFERIRPWQADYPGQ
mgnify:CR=1 FL=1